MTSVLQFKQAKTMKRIDLASTIQAAFENELKFNQNDGNNNLCMYVIIDKYVKFAHYVCANVCVCVRAERESQKKKNAQSFIMQIQ